MKKILASLLAITMLLTTMSACVIPASAETVASNAESQPEYIYKEDFSAYAIDGTNWLTEVDTSSALVTVNGVEKGKFTARKAASGTNTHSAKVVIDPLDTTGENKVMALDAWDTKVGTSDNNYEFASQFRINAKSNQGIKRSTMGVGKKLVYKAKIYVPANFVMYETAFLVNPAKEWEVKNSSFSAHSARGTGAWYSLIRTGTTDYVGSAGVTYDIRGSWTEIKHVIDVSKPLSATHSDTARAYWGDRLLIADVVAGANQHGHNEKYQLNVGDIIIDNLPAKALFQNGAEYESMGDTYWGNQFIISTSKNTPTNGNSKYYIDDLEAYWIDALAFDAINAAEYQGGNIKLVFNQKLKREVKTKEKYLNRSYTYDKLFSLVDKNGNTVSGTTVELSADDKTVTIKPGALEKGADYRIVIDPKLIDEHGQGLENNSKATYVNVHVSEEMVDFGATLSKDTITKFKTGRETKVTATFTHEVEDAAITNGIVVKNTETQEVIAKDHGWTAEFGANKKEVIFDFTNLPTADYTVSANENLVSASGLRFTGSFNITIQGAAKPIELFNETFESNSGFTYPEGNWFDQPKNNSLNNFAYSGRRRVGNWDVQRVDEKVNGKDEEEDSTISFIGVVDAPAGVEGGLDRKVLKIHSAENDGGSISNNTISFRRNFTTDCKPINFAKEYPDKQLVYEADVYAESMGSNAQFFLPSLTKDTINVTSDGVWNNYFSGGQFYAQGGHYGGSFESYGPVSAWAWASTPSKDSIKTEARKLKIVIDQSTELDTMRIYLNGNLVKRAAGDVARLKDHEMNNEDRFDLGPGYSFANGDKYGRKFDMNTVGNAQGMFGIWSAVVGTASSPTTIYIDNFKAYLVDPFEVESVTGASDAFNVAKGAVTFTFTKPVKASTISGNVVLLDENGNEVADGIKSATLTDAGYKLEVKLSDTLQANKTFTIKLKKELTDEDGYSIKTQYHYYDYPIADIYPLKEGTDNVYLVSDSANNPKIWECTYTAKTETTPAYLTYNDSYKAAVDAYLPDYKKMQTAVDVTISAYTSVFAEATSATIDGNTVKTSVTFTNPESAPMNVWAVVAAYGDYNQMLGCSQVKNGEIPVGKTGPVDVTINVENASKVTAVKLFVWDTYTNMKPYHKAAEL